jgi:hypothetical protein
MKPVRRVAIMLRPSTMEGRLVTWIVACIVGGVGLGTAAALIAWAALFSRKGAAFLVKCMVARVICFCLIG